jgi:hypothetical protein
LGENDVRFVLAYQNVRGSDIEMMDDAMVVTEDVKQRRYRKRNFLVVLEGGKKRRLQPAERHNVAMPMLGAFGKTCRAAGEKHHRVIVGLRKRLGQSVGAFRKPCGKCVLTLAHNKDVRDSQGRCHFVYAWIELGKSHDDLRAGVFQQRRHLGVRIVRVHGGYVGMCRHCSENAHRHLQAIGHEDCDALSFDTKSLQSPRKTRNRFPVLSKGQASIFADQREAIRRSARDIFQRVKNGWIIGCIGGNF